MCLAVSDRGCAELLRSPFARSSQNSASTLCRGVEQSPPLLASQNGPTLPCPGVDCGSELLGTLYRNCPRGDLVELRARIWPVIGYKTGEAMLLRIFVGPVLGQFR